MSAFSRKKNLRLKAACGKWKAAWLKRKQDSITSVSPLLLCISIPLCFSSEIEIASTLLGVR